MTVCRRPSGKGQTARMFRRTSLLVLAIAMTACSGVMPGGGKTRNVILLVGDGMDAHQITIARNYLVGPTGRLALDELPGRADVGVVTLDEQTPGRFRYVLDSANTATALATGTTTSRGRVATAARTDADLETIVELASAAGYRTGVISTAEVTDATPASFVAHIAGRWCKAPQDMQRNPLCANDRVEAGGPGSIARQLAASGLDLLLGGGREDFGEGAGSPRALAEAAGFTVLTTGADLDTAPLGSRWLGLFTEGNFTPRMTGEDGRSAEVVGEGGVFPEPMKCVDNLAATGQPGMLEMTRRAVARLTDDPGRGFFLMVESALIDKASHVRSPCSSIAELAQLDETLRFLADFAGSHGDTLIIVTADHTQAAQLVPNTSLYRNLSDPVHTPGRIARLQLSDGSLMGVNYATNSYFVEEHTGAHVPLHTNMPERFPGFLTQSDVFGVMARFLGLEPSAG